MDVKGIVVLVFVLLVIIYIVINAFSKSSELTKMADGKILQTITAASVKNTSNSSNFTYSMWVYVDDWNYKFGSKKTILSRAGCPDVNLGDKPNTITININYYDADTDSSTAPKGYEANTSNCAANASNASACAACNKGFQCACKDCDPVLYAATHNADGSAKTLTPPCTNTPPSIANSVAAGTVTPGTSSSCEIDNIPIQKWVCIIISLYGRTLDTYLNGKLVRTCIIPGVPKIDNNSDISVTPNGGFSGWTTTFKYWPSASNPQEVYNIYKDGFGGSILGNALSKYRLRFTMLQDNEETGSFEI
jgi:hypothetical protein